MVAPGAAAATAAAAAALTAFKLTRPSTRELPAVLRSDPVAVCVALSVLLPLMYAVSGTGPFGLWAKGLRLPGRAAWVRAAQVLTIAFVAGAAAAAAAGAFHPG